MITPAERRVGYAISRNQGFTSNGSRYSVQKYREFRCRVKFSVERIAIFLREGGCNSPQTIGGWNGKISLNTIAQTVNVNILLGMGFLAEAYMEKRIA